MKKSPRRTVWSFNPSELHSILLQTLKSALDAWPWHPLSLIPPSPQVPSVSLFAPCLPTLPLIPSLARSPQCPDELCSQSRHPHWKSSFTLWAFTSGISHWNLSQELQNPILNCTGCVFTWRPADIPASLHVSVVLAKGTVLHEVAQILAATPTPPSAVHLQFCLVHHPFIQWLFTERSQYSWQWAGFGDTMEMENRRGGCRPALMETWALCDFSGLSPKHLFLSSSIKEVPLPSSVPGTIPRLLWTRYFIF